MENQTQCSKNEIESSSGNVRHMLREDFAAVAALSAQLGYPSTEREIAQRFGRLADGQQHGLFVACGGGAVVGWCHVYRVNLLETDGYAELGGLVVDESVRGNGFGRDLLAAAEGWASERGFSRLRLYAGSQRDEAFRFYSKAGYAMTQPTMFQKHLDS